MNCCCCCAFTCVTWHDVTWRGDDMPRGNAMMQHRELPSKYSYDKLSFIFGVSREAVARIVKSKWTRERNAAALLHLL